MARTPLFTVLQQAAALARRANRTGQPVSELWLRAQGEAAARAYSRREFLQASGLAAATSLAGCALPALVTRGDDAEVAVIGAGIAGLTAAYRLHQAGVRVRLYEAQERVGGRMLSLRGYFPHPQVVELGAELIDTPHRCIRALAEELGLILDDFRNDDPALAQDLLYFSSQRSSVAALAEAFMPVAQAIERELAGLGDGDITYQNAQGAEALDRLTITGWLDRAGVSGTLRKLIEVAYTTEMGLDCEEQSALNLLTLIGTDKLEIFGISDERFHVRGGNDLIVRGLAQRLEDVIETGAMLQALRLQADGRYQMTLSRGSSSREIVASHVILALPFSTLRDVRLALPLPPVKQQAISELRYGTNAKLMIGFSERVWRTRHASNGSTFSDLEYQTSWETTRLQPGAGGVLVNFVGGRHGVMIGAGTPEHQAELAVRGLEQVFPGLARHREGMKAVRFHWPSNPYVKGSYACYTPGQWTSLRGVMGETVGRLYFAGEHCSLENQGFMEGGCETGESAAAAVLKDLRRASRAQVNLLLTSRPG
jgi:monoamine oxidase